MRFRTKTILGVAAIEMVLLAILVGSTLSILRNSNELELTRRVQLGGKLLAAAAKDAVISQDLATLDSLVEEAMGTGQIDSVRVLDARGMVLSERGDANLMSRPFRQDERIDQIEDGYFDFSVPVMAGGILHGEVRLAVSTDPLHTLIASARSWAAGIAGLEMLLVALFSWLLGSYLLRQLVALRAASQSIAAGNFDHRITVSGNDELAQTATAFNHMAQQIGEGHKLLQIENQNRIKAQEHAEIARNQADDRSEQLNAVFALTPDGFVAFNAHRRVKYANPAFYRLSGLDKSEIVGLDESGFSERLSQKCIDDYCFAGIAVLREMNKSSTGDDYGHRQKIELADAGRHILEIGLRESQSATISQILYVRDVTHETEVDRMKTEFLSTSAHELRTPMASIYGYAELMIMHEFNEEERKEFLGVIYNKSGLMISIINEMIDLARIDSKHGIDFVIKRFDVSEMLRAAVGDFKVPQGRTPPRVGYPDQPIWVLGDQNKLHQATNNVLSNAYKYSSDDSEVTIEIVCAGNQLQHDSVYESSMVGIRISDHGIGMTKAQLGRVFERFYRADDSGKTPGAGLGISITKEIVDLHGGHVTIESMIGQGTVVTIWLRDDDQKTDK
ncbi:MAG: ATP-binding protein [Sideroxydans sp.]|jgi:signal transduction histidine kinase